MAEKMNSLSKYDLVVAAHLIYPAQLGSTNTKILDNCNDLQRELGYYLQSDRGDSQPLKIVYNASQEPEYWTELEFSHTDQTLYYSNYHGPHEVPNEIKQLFGKFDVVIQNYPPCDPYDSGILALHNAMQNEVLTATPQLAKEWQLKREQFTNCLKSMNVLKVKVSMLLRTLNTFENDSAEFSHNSAIIFLYFLETFALQNDGVGNYQQELTIVIGADDVRLIRHARNKILLHREASTAAIIEPHHLKVLLNACQLNGKSTVQAFFDDMKLYVQNILEKLNDCLKNINVRGPSSFLKHTAVLGNDGPNRQTPSSKQDEIHLHILREAFGDDRRNLFVEKKLLFDMLVNFYPFAKGKKQCPKTLKDIDYIRNKHIHDFYELGDDEYSMEYALINFLRDNRRRLFSCYLARAVIKLLGRLSANIHDDNERESIVQELSGCLHELKDNIAYCDIVRAQPTIEQRFKLLLVIANENAIHLRKERIKGAQFNTSTRYDQLTVTDLLKIENELMKLKQLKSEDIHQYRKRSDTLRRILETHYDISHQSFQLLVDLLINGVDIKDRDAKGLMASVRADVTALISEFQCTINVHKSFTVKYILQAYRKRVNGSGMFTKGSFQEKISCIPKACNTKVMLQENYTVEISGDKFVATIFQMRTDEDRRRRVYCDLQEAFDDPVFLEYVEDHKLQFYNLIDNENIRRVPTFLAPLLARLLVSQRVKLNESLQYVLQELSQKSIEHHVYLLNNAEKLNYKKKFSFIWNAIWNVIKNNNFTSESIEVIFKKSGRNVIKKVIVECINYIDKASSLQIKLVRSVAWKLLESFDTVLVKKLFMNEYEEALKMLFSDDELEKIAIETANRAPEILWRLRLTAAKINWKVWDLNKSLNGHEFQTCLFRAIDDLMILRSNFNLDRFERYYFVTFNYLGKAQHSYGNPGQAYNTYTEFEKELVRHVFNENAAVTGSWSKEAYEYIMRSERYKEFAEDLPCFTNKYFDINDHLNVFRMRNNKSYYLHFRGIESENISDSRQALALFEEVLETMTTLGSDQREVIRTKKSLSRVNWDLGKALRTRGDLKSALKHFEKSLKLSTDVVESQKIIFWEYHPAVIKYFRYTIYAYDAVAQLLNVLVKDKFETYQRFKTFVQSNANIIKHFNESELIYSVGVKLREPSVVHEDCTHNIAPSYYCMQISALWICAKGIIYNEKRLSSDVEGQTVEWFRDDQF